MPDLCIELCLLWGVGMPFTDSTGTVIHYVVAGSGPPVLLHHGFSNSLECWQDTGYVDLLAARFRLIMIDARGHGSSGKPHEPDAYTLQHQVDDVIAVLDDVGVERVHFYGYSLGGRIGFALARSRPDRLASIALGGASAYGAPLEDRQGFLKTLQEGLDAYVAFAGSVMQLSDALRRRVLANDIDALVALWTQRTEEDVEFLDVIPNLRVPYLLLAGSKDFAYPGILEHSRSLRPGALVTHRRCRSHPM
jgi:pimeloyl-ACP methyl ester carboxylesterase